RADRDRRSRCVDARLAARDSVVVPDPRSSRPSRIGAARRGERIGPMAFNLVALPVRRPTATSMFFLGLVLLGLFAWYRIPIELLPALRGEQLFVSFARPGSEPEVVEREILLPLEARVGELPGLAETWGEVNGSSGRLMLE